MFICNNHIRLYPPGVPGVDEVTKSVKVSPIKLSAMDSNSVSPMPELAPIAEFDKSPPSPPNEEVPMDDLPPPPATISQAEGKKLKV